MNLSAGGPGALFSPDDLACPICVETIEDAFATPCGHTFCFKCISTHLKNKSTCPSCGAHLVQDQIHPNFLLNKLIKRAATVQDSQSLKTALLQHVQHDLAAAGSSIGLQELDAAIQLLQDKRQQLATHESSNKLQLLMLFLQHAKAKQLGQLSELEQQLDVLQQDLAKARAAAAAAGGAAGNGNDQQQQQQQQQQQLNGVGSVHDHAAAAAAAGSRSATPPQQQLQPLLGHPPAAAAAAAGEAGGVSAGLGGSLVGGRSSAFTRLPPAGGLGQQSEQQQQQQQQQGFGPLGSAQQQQPQQGFRPLPTSQPSPRQQQQQQAAPSQLPSQPQQQQQQPPLQQQQQQQQQAMGFRPLPRPQQQQQQQQPTTGIGQRGFRPFTPPTQQQAAQSPTQAGPAVLPKSNPLEPAARQEQKPAVGFQGFRPFGAQQGATAGEPAGAAAAAGGGGMGAANGAAGPAQQQQQQQQGFRPVPQQQQQQQQQGFRPLPPAQDPMQPIQQQQQLQQQQQHQQQGFRPLPASQGLDDASLNPEKKRKILEQFDELQQAYLNSRIRRQSTGSTPSPAAAAAAEGTAVGIQAPQQAAVVAAAGVAAVQQQQQWKWPEGAALNGGNVDQQSSRPNLQVKATTALKQQPQQGRGQHLVAAAGAGGSNAPPAAPAAPTAAAAAAPGGPVGGVQPGQGDEGVLDAFSRMLYAVTHYSKLQPLAYVPSSANRTGGGAGGAQILSSVDFDCAGRLFAAAGVQQRIFVHDYQSVITHGGPPQQQQQQQQQPAAGSDAAGDTALLPMLDLATGSKISCVSFSPAVQQYLLSSDYAGVVQLWDLTGGRTVRQWEAHDKRIWAVDFCPLDPTTFATGSDDGTVKVWGLCEAPVPRLTLPVRANVCSIKFSPANPHMLAAGNAGHQVHLFDLRSPRAPLAVLKGHNKAVSYVRWAGADTLVTASTDSTLRLWTASGGRGSSDSAAGQQQQQQPPAAGSSWDAEEGGWHCSQVFRGHANSKHFVGLATQGPFIACGSETNEVFMYHQGLAQPSLKCLLKPWEGSSSSSGLGGDGAGAGGNFGADGGGTSAAAAAGAGTAAVGAGAAGGKSPFVSALCWKKDSDVLVAANSKGGVWVLSMQ